MAAGADVNARITDVTSRTARWGRGSTLPERGGQSALFGAVQWAWPRVVQYLIDHGAEVAIVDDRRVSPLDAALGRAGSSDNRPSPEVAKITPDGSRPIDCRNRDEFCPLSLLIATIPWSFVVSRGAAPNASRRAILI
jgi:hypothetical protein